MASAMEITKDRNGVIEAAAPPIPQKTRNDGSRTWGTGPRYQTRAHLLGTSTSTLIRLAALRTAASTSCRIRPLNGLISIQYARKRRLVATSAHNTRVSVLSSVAPSARIPTSKFHAAFAVPAGAGARN